MKMFNWNLLLGGTEYMFFILCMLWMRYFSDVLDMIILDRKWLCQGYKVTRAVITVHAAHTADPFLIYLVSVYDFLMEIILKRGWWDIINYNYLSFYCNRNVGIPYSELRGEGTAREEEEGEKEWEEKDKRTLGSTLQISKEKTSKILTWDISKNSVSANNVFECFLMLKNISRF